MNISAAGSDNVLGQAQVLMLSKAMDMAKQQAAQLLSVLPAPGGSGQQVDTFA
jgi:Putative motility protein